MKMKLSIFALKKTLAVLSKSKLHNREDVDRKTLEGRIRKLKNNGKLKPEYNEERNENLFIIPDCVLRPARKHKEYSVTTPDGDMITGVIVDLHKTLLERFPEHVPKGYTTVQSRIKKSDWNIQQAFGFDYPPANIFSKKAISPIYFFYYLKNFIFYF